MELSIPNFMKSVAISVKLNLFENQMRKDVVVNFKRE